MGQRLQLHEVLKGLTEFVYFQPPANITLQYPCILYERDDSDDKYADNVTYAHTKRYTVTVVDRDPDSDLSDAVEGLPMCKFDRYFAADDLNHYVFTLYF